MPSFRDIAVFHVGAARFTWNDVLTDPAGDGWWERLRTEAAEGLVCLALLDQGSDDEISAVEEAVEAVATTFRYDRGLVSAEEAEAWLAGRRVNVGDWLGSLRRRVLRERWADRAASVVDFPSPDGPAVERAAWVDARFWDVALDRARRLARRVAGAVAVGASVAGMTPEGRWAAIAEGVDRFRAARLTGKAIRHEVAGRALDWIRVNGLMVEFPDSAQAAEAALCVREDGLALDQVARDARRDCVPLQAYVEDLAPEQRAAFVSANPPELVGPFRTGDSHRLVWVARKVLPTVDDPDVVLRAASRVLDRALAAEAEARVAWRVEW